MEFPDLGQHCSHSSCHRLDFLPVRCDLCSGVFCADHYSYSSHGCEKGLHLDNQVPVCPLCDKPVPIKRGELPDIRVGQHIDLDCESDPALKKRNQIYRNKCWVKGCKQKELVPLLCNDCHHNYCLKHRHPADHTCEPTRTAPAASAVSMAGSAAMKRFEQMKTNVTQRVSQMSSQMSMKSSPQSVRSHSNDVFGVQGNYSEDEALARALQQSMLDENHSSGATNTTQYDRDLAKAIEESQRNAVRNKDKCSVS
ncbi:unnamed protein product [Oppiella nova]|uniref:AN1-type domain-containing protein n=1 Tax=Oppiella nova TaxID=334625 RepID=A0A7R9M326_9ACAR|nr:unnamed protein product [Oppiella nova]CAG2169303.1 unnamed protein product [Oppiella nova]